MPENQFPACLRRLREQRGMSRKALGECCGLSKNIVGQYERSEKEPSVKTLIILADFFDIPLDDLVGRK